MNYTRKNFLENKIYKMQKTLSGLDDMIEDCKDSGEEDTLKNLKNFKKTVSKEINKNQDKLENLKNSYN